MHKILLVEDNEINRDLLTRRLSVTASRYVVLTMVRRALRWPRAKCQI